MPYRVIQWYTGSIARQQIRLIRQHPELELVGAVVYHADKAGKDVGEILREQPIGLKTMGEAEVALGLDADVVLYNAPFERYDEIIRILASGKNVITPSAAFYPRNRPEFDDLQRACEQGGATLLGTGVNPGFAGDVLPLVASSLCARVRSVEIRELGDLRGWDPFMLTEVMRFGRAVEELEKDADYFEFMSNSFEQSCCMLAEALGFEVESVATQPSFARATRDLLDGRVKAGTVGGIRLVVSVIAGGGSWTSGPRLARHLRLVRGPIRPISYLSTYRESPSHIRPKRGVVSNRSTHSFNSLAGASNAPTRGRCPRPEDRSANPEPRSSVRKGVGA